MKFSLKVYIININYFSTILFISFMQTTKFYLLLKGSSKDIGTCLLKVSIHQKVIETQLKNFAR